MARLRYLQGDSGVRKSGFLNNSVRTIRGVYETDPEVARALLPQPLVGLDRPEIYFQFAHVAMHVSPERTVEIGALTMGVHCSYEGQAGSYCFVMAMEGESVVTSGRERFGEPKKIADTTFEKTGDHVRATVRRHRITFFEVEGDIGADNSNPKTFEEHLFCYKGLPSITTPGEFDGDVFLTRLDWKRDYTTRRDFAGKVTLRESVYDPLVDVPVRRMIGMEYVEGSTITSGVLLRKVPGEWIAHHWVGRNDEPANVGINLSAQPTEKGGLMQDLKGRVAVVTGGASGVGRAIGVRLVAEGAQVVLADINQDRLDEVAAELGGGTVGIRVDVTKEESVEALAAEVYARFGACHLLFNNAGVGLGEATRPIWTLPLNDWNWGIDVNVLGVVHGIKSFVPRMLESGAEGVVINTSSSNGGLRSLPNTPIYAATKAAVTSLTEVLHQQLLKHGGGKVSAAILFPGPHTVNTAIMASRKVRPSEYASATPEAPVAYETMQQLMETTGLKMKLTEPEDVADFAVDGVKAGKFWLLPESEDGDKMVRTRIEGLLARANPPSAW